MKKHGSFIKYWNIYKNTEESHSRLKKKISWSPVTEIADFGNLWYFPGAFVSLSAPLSFMLVAFQTFAVSFFYRYSLTTIQSTQQKVCCPYLLSLYAIGPITQDIIISNVSLLGKNVIDLVLIMCPFLPCSNMIAEVLLSNPVKGWEVPGEKSITVSRDHVIKYVSCSQNCK